MKLQSLFNFLDHKVLAAISMIWHDQGSFVPRLPTTNAYRSDYLNDLLYKSLIYLGDLARYRQLYSENKTRQWAIARRFYNLAQHVVPYRGNTYNQIAVLDTYEGKEMDAISMYLRSICVLEPFPTAVENIQLLMEKARNNTKSNLEFDQEFLKLIGQLFNTSLVSNTFIHESTAFITQFQDFLASKFTERKVSSMFTILVSILHLNLNKQLASKIIFPTLDEDVLPTFLINLLITFLQRIDKLNQEKMDSIENLGMIDLDNTRHHWEQFLIILKLVLKIAGSEMMDTFSSNNLSEFWLVLSQAGTSISLIKEKLGSMINKGEYCLYEDEQFIDFLPLKSKFLNHRSIEVSKDPYSQQDLAEIRCYQIISDLKLLSKNVTSINQNKNIFMHNNNSIVVFTTSSEPPTPRKELSDLITPQTPKSDSECIWQTPGGLSDISSRIGLNSDPRRPLSSFSTRLNLTKEVTDDMIVNSSPLPPSAIKYNLKTPSLLARNGSPTASPVTPLSFLSELPGIPPTTRSESPLFSRLSSHQQNMVSPHWDRFSLYQMKSKSSTKQVKPTPVVDWIGALGKDDQNTTNK